MRVHISIKVDKTSVLKTTSFWSLPPSYPSILCTSSLFLSWWLWITRVFCRLSI